MRANVAAFLLGNQGVILTGYWRRDRDSNPGYGVNPYNALAGRPLRPLGHLSALPANRNRVSQLPNISPWRGDYSIRPCALKGLDPVRMPYAAPAPRAPCISRR